MWHMYPVLNPYDPEFINLRLVGNQNTILQMRIKRCDPLMHFMVVYATRVGLPLSVLRFRFRGLPLDGTETPMTLGMNHGDALEVYKISMTG